MLVHIGTSVCLLTRSAVIAHVQAPGFELPECWTTFEIYQLVRLVFIPIAVPCGMLTLDVSCAQMRTAGTRKLCHVVIGRTNWAGHQSAEGVTVGRSQIVLFNPSPSRPNSAVQLGTH